MLGMLNSYLPKHGSALEFFIQKAAQELQKSTIAQVALTSIPEESSSILGGIDSMTGTQNGPITVEYYIENTSQGHNKNYVVYLKDGVYIGIWGAIYGSPLGYTKFNNRDHAVNTVRKKVREGYHNEPYHSRDLTGRLRYAEKSFDEIFKNEKVPSGKTIDEISASSQEMKDKTKQALSTLRSYLEFNPEDHRMMKFAKEIYAMTPEERVLSFVQRKGVSEWNVLLEKPFVNEVILFISRVRQGKNFLDEYLRSLTPEILDSANVEENEKDFLRSLYQIDDHSLMQMSYLRYIQRKIHKSNESIVPMFKYRKEFK
jgi:hypothetical protein